MKKCPVELSLNSTDAFVIFQIDSQNFINLELTKHAIESKVSN